MKVTGFDWDEGNWPKCAKHGLSKEDIEFVLLTDPLVLPDRNPPDGEVRYNAIGHTAEGRTVFVVFTPRFVDKEELIRPISARYMHQKESDHYGRQKGT